MKKIKDPFTGKMVNPRPKTLDMVDAKPLSAAQRASMIETISNELAELRKQYVELGNHRYGGQGLAMSRKYNRLTVMYRHLTGVFPPDIGDDL